MAAEFETVTRTAPWHGVNMAPISDIVRAPEFDRAIGDYLRARRYLPVSDDGVARMAQFMFEPERSSQQWCALAAYANWLTDLYGWNDRDWLRL